MKYSVCLLFDRTTHDLLLQKKDRTIFAGRYNGVGGKQDSRDEPMEICAKREIYEESGVNRIKKFTWLGNLILPEDCVAGREGKPAQLYFYAGLIDKSDVKVMPGATEQLEFFPLTCFDGSGEFPHELAGDGDLAYFIHRAMRVLFGTGVARTA